MKKSILTVFILLILIVVAVSGIVFLMKKQIPQQNTYTELNIDKTVIGVEQINFVLYSIKACELHKSPLSSDTPKLEFIIGDEVYSCEVIKGNLNTKKGIIEGRDMRIIMPREEFINALNSASIKNYLQQSVEDGKTRIEVFSGNTKLFLKGYLSLYEEITGKKFVGSLIKNF